MTIQKEQNASKIHHLNIRLTFQSFSLKCFGYNASGFALDLLSLPESFAQLLHIMSIHNICVPPIKHGSILTFYQTSTIINPKHMDILTSEQTR